MLYSGIQIQGRLGFWQAVWVKFHALEMRNIAKHAISGKIVEFLRRNFAFNQTGKYFKQNSGLVLQGLMG